MDVKLQTWHQQIKEGKIGGYQYVVNVEAKNPIERYTVEVKARDNGDIIQRVCGHGLGCFWTDWEVIDHKHTI